MDYFSGDCRYCRALRNFWVKATTNMNEKINPIEENSAPLKKEMSSAEKLADLKRRREILLKWIKAGEGVPADRAVMDKLNDDIEKLEK